MTETSSLVSTHPVSYPYAGAVASATTTPPLNGDTSPNLQEDEEEYTIKCICGFTDDDGSTVLCEKCDTWQHIQCYYQNKIVEESDVHVCVDCDKRPSHARGLDVDKARERQKVRRTREQIDGRDRDRKIKKPATKSHKKKHRDTIQNDLPNGHVHHDKHNSVSNGRDQPPPAKKSKTNHRASGSVASINGIANGINGVNVNGNGESRKRAHSTLQSYPSPATSPHETQRFQVIPRYTTEFLELYVNDSNDAKAHHNDLSIQGANYESTWKTNPDLLVDDPHAGPSALAPFLRTDIDFANHNWPEVVVENKPEKENASDGRHPFWRLLRLKTDVTANTLIGEIRGQIGSLDEYCHQLTCQNRWHELKHPDPFVFFHQYIDIYIDSRKSGTPFRYIRRSCDHNVTLRSFVDSHDEVHHCFVAKKNIPAGTELRAAWYLDKSLFGEDVQREDKDQLYQERCECISRVLANFGDCACTADKCMLASYDRRTSSKTLESIPKPGAGRKKKVKPRHAVSPLSTGQATNSRAGSEALKVMDDDDDQRSTSESSKSGAQSRDLTPQRGLLDADPMLGSGLTAREMRKIQALEKSSKEQNAKGEKKQKKRPSGGSALNTPGSSSRYGYEAKQRSGSPPYLKTLRDGSNRSVPSRAFSKPRPTYAEAAVQTDPEPEECMAMLPPLKKRKFSTPTQKLLKKLLNSRAASKSPSETSPADSSTRTVQSPETDTKSATCAVASPSPPPPTSKSTGTETLPLPSQAAHTQQVPTKFKTPAPRLNLPTLPPVPTFQSTQTTTPGSVTPNIAQSPGTVGASLSSFPGMTSNSVAASPAKKKLSLGAYLSRRKESTTPATERPILLSNDSNAASVTSDIAVGDEPGPDVLNDNSSNVPTVDTTSTQMNGLGLTADVQMTDAMPIPAQENLASVKTTTPPLLESKTSMIEPTTQKVAPEVTNVLHSLHQLHSKQEATKT